MYILIVSDNMGMLATLSTFALFYLAATTVGAVVASGLAIVAWRHRDEPAAPQFALLNITVAGWCATAVLARLGVPGAGYIWHINNIFVFSLIYVWFAFVLAYTGRSEWIRRWPLLILWLIPGSIVLTALYPPAQSILVVSGPKEMIEGLTVVTWTMTDLGVATLVFVFLLDIAAFLLLGLFMYRSRSPYRKQVGAIIGARLFGLVTGIAFYAGLFPYSDLSLVPAAYAAQSLVIAWAMFRYDLLDTVPLTADTIVDQMADAVVVLDADDRVVDYNPALSELVSSNESPISRHVETVLPGLRAALEREEAVELAPANSAATQRSYQPQSTSVYDHHDIYRGQLIVLRDVTIQQTRERTLELLQSATERFLDATDPAAVAEIATETAQQALDCPYSGVIRYEEGEERLRPAAMTDELSGLLEESGLERNGDGHLTARFARENELWQVFEHGEPRFEVPIWVRSDDEPALTAALFPLGEHGIFGVGRRADEGGFSDEDRRFARTLADSTETALDRLKRERELEESRRAVEQRTEQLQFFNSALRHDLRNAVQVIQANLGSLSDHVTNSGRSHLDTVSAWVDDMTSLIETVGSLTEAIAGTEPEEQAYGPVDLAATLEKRVGKVAESHDRATVETEIPDDLRVVGSDLVGEVIDNILLNALEHNDSEQLLIDVSARKTEDAVVVRIADNGPGIPEKFQGEVFSPGITSDESGSIGFGLYFVKVMMEEYGGRVHFETNEPRGTVAVLTFERAATGDTEARSTAELSGKDTDIVDR